jgi:ABC-type polysaccharide/polyol phosphate export permease
MTRPDGGYVNVTENEFQPTNVYDSSRRKAPLLDEFRQLIKYRNLIAQLISSSIKTRYKRSALGVIWTLLNPLLMMIILTVVFSQFFKFQIQNYAIYVLSGLIMWNFFSSSTTAAMQNIIINGSLVNRIYMPKSVFAVAAIGTGLVNLLLSLIPLFLISLIMGVPMHLSLLVLPFSIILLTLFALGVGLILQTAAVYFADMLPVYEVILSIWFYATPIIYPRDMIPPQLARIFQLNPLYHLVRVFRAPLYEGIVPNAAIWAVATFVAVVTFIIGGLVFTAKSNEYAYRI